MNFSFLFLSMLQDKNMIDKCNAYIMVIRDMLQSFAGYEILGNIMTDDKVYNRKLADIIIKNIYKSFPTTSKNTIGDNKP